MQLSPAFAGPTINAPHTLTEMTMTIDATLSEAIAALKAGGVIAYPTEAVWGLGCDPGNEAAVLELLAMKRREMAKGLILVAADVAQIESYLRLLTAEQRARVIAKWPGPFTWVVPVDAEVPAWLRGEHTSLALRVSAHPLVRELCTEFGGPLVSTSANIAGDPPARTRDELATLFGSRLAAITPGELGGDAKPTEICDAVTGDVLRAR